MSRRLDGGSDAAAAREVDHAPARAAPTQDGLS